MNLQFKFMNPLYNFNSKMMQIFKAHSSYIVQANYLKW